MGKKPFKLETKIYLIFSKKEFDGPQVTVYMTFLKVEVFIDILSNIRNADLFCNSKLLCKLLINNWYEFHRRCYSKLCAKLKWLGTEFFHLHRIWCLGGRGSNKILPRKASFSSMLERKENIGTAISICAISKYDLKLY